MPQGILGKWWSGLTSFFRGLLLLAGFGFIALLSAWLTVILVIRGREVSVPDLSEMSTREALAVLQEEDLNLSVQEAKAQFSEDVPAGRVLKQEPSPGTLLKQNRKVKVILSLGARRFKMPDLSDNSVQHTRILLNQNGLSLGTVARTFFSTIPANRVIAHDPPSGIEKSRGGRVDLLVSRGKKEDVFVMPDLIGRQVETIRFWLQARRFRVGRTLYTRYEGLERGVILEQSPPAGHPVNRRQIIELTVNR